MTGMAFLVRSQSSDSHSLYSGRLDASDSSTWVLVDWSDGGFLTNDVVSSGRGFRGSADLEGVAPDILVSNKM